MIRWVEIAAFIFLVILVLSMCVWAAWTTNL
jgi:hypothetical protein